MDGWMDFPDEQVGGSLVGLIRLFRESRLQFVSIFYLVLYLAT